MTNYLIITGGSRGIGKNTIAHFMQHGWTCINIARTACDLSGVNNIKIDLQQLNEIEKQKAHLIQLLENPEKICLVHNAATNKRDTVSNLSIDDLSKQLNVNLLSAVALNKIIIPFMKQQSSIINLGSTLAEKAVPGNASYIISKHAVVGLMRATCQDLAAQQITTACICPGLVDTQLLGESVNSETINWLVKHKIIGKRLIHPEEIAQVIHFCATHPVINGEVIHVNLGQLTV